MTKISVRSLLLSCVVASAFVGSVAVPMAQAQTSQSFTMQTTTVSPGESVNAVNSANAAAAYTGNPALAQQAAQPGQAMMPNGMQQMGPFQPAEPPPTMRYDKKAAEGAFYGVELPQRLFNNVPSHW